MSFGSLASGISPLIATFGKDVVAIYRQGVEGKEDEQIFEDASIIQANIDENVTFYRHPLENGRTIVDHRIIQPVTIEMRLILTDSVSPFRAARKRDLDSVFVRARDIYKQIQTEFIAGSLLSIQTRTDTYRNQIIQSIPHDETTEMFGGVALVFNTSELQLETDNVPTPSEGTDQDTVERGKLSPLEVVQEVANRVGASAELIFRAI